MLPALESGGVERGTVEFAGELVPRGHDSFVLSSGGSLVARLEQEGSRHFELPVHRKHPVSLLQVRAIGRLLSEVAPDIVHLRSRLPAWLTRFAWRGLADPKPQLVTTVHGFYSVSRYSAVMTRGEAVIAVSSAIRDYILANYPRTPENRIRVIPRGVNTAEFHPEARPVARPQHVAAGSKILLMPGRLSRWKGQELFLALLRRLLDREEPGRKVAGIVLGAAEPGKQHYAKELQRLSKKLGLESRVFFAGQQQNMAGWYRLADLVCSLPRRPEPFGRTVTESLACATPVVALDDGGPGEVLRDCFPAGLVPVVESREKQLDLLAEASCRLLERTAPISFPDHYKLSAQTEATLDVYESLLKTRRGRENPGQKAGTNRKGVSDT